MGFKQHSQSYIHPTLFEGVPFKLLPLLRHQCHTVFPMLLLVFSELPAGSLSLDHIHFAEFYALNDFITKKNIAAMYVLLLGILLIFGVYV